MTGVNIGAVLVTDGKDAFIAYRQGDTVTGSYYTVRGGLGIAKEIFNDKVLGTVGKTSVKAGPVLQATIGVLDVSYNIGKAITSDDKFVRQYYTETAVAAGIDAAIGLIPVYGSAITGAWSVTYYGMKGIYGALGIPWGQFTNLASSPGSAIVFLVEFKSGVIVPSAFATDGLSSAYEDVAEILEFYRTYHPEENHMFVPPDG
ncbi:Uncharacterised protein [uncultured archaeon]|nr:Uncharacterised protein [uncultured archaeon]